MVKLNFIYSIALLSMCICFTSCENEVEASSERIPIRISLSPQSRATDDSFENGDKVGLYVSNYSNSAPSTLKTTGNHVDNAMFTNNSSTWGSDEQLYWKDNTTSADFYAYYPYQQEISDVNECEFSVLQNQSKIENLQASFFLWGKVAGQTPTEAPISIETNHLMSSIRIYLKYDETMTEEEKKKYNISELRVQSKTNALIDIATGTVTATGDDELIIPYNEGECYRAVIVPQEKIYISLRASGEHYSLGYNIKFLSNTLHKLTVNIQKNKLTAGVTFSIGEWKEDTEEHSGTIGIHNLKENIQFIYPMIKTSLIEQNEGLDSNADGEISYEEAAVYGTPTLKMDESLGSDYFFFEFIYFTSAEIIYSESFSNLHEITIPSSVKTIQYNAFDGIISTITFTSLIPPTLESDYIGNDIGNIVVPKVSVNLYKQAMPEYADKIVGW